MKRVFWPIVLLQVVLLNWSCHLEDFELDKLVKVDIKPKVFVPLVYGTFAVDDYLPLAIKSAPDNQIITVQEIALDPLEWQKGQINIQSNALDSVYLVVEFTNGTPMKMEFDIAFTNYGTGTVIGRNFPSGVLSPGVTDANGNVIEASITQVKFAMTRADLNNLKMSSGLQGIVSLSQPDLLLNNTVAFRVTAKNLKESYFKIQVSFQGKVLLGELE